MVDAAPATPVTDLSTGQGIAPAAAAPGRIRILDEAAALFLRRGFDGTSLRDIAAACDMKAGSLYYHFGSKNELLTEVLRRGMAIMVEAFEAAATEAAATQADARTRLASHVRAHLAALHENGPYTAVHVTTFRTAPTDVRTDIVPLRDAYEARWTHLLATLRTDGELDPDTPVALTRLNLFATMNHSIEWFDADRGNLDELAATIAHQLWQGIAA